MRIPSASAVSPSSSPEQSIPLLTTPIFSVRSMRRSPGRTAPGRATGTRWPAAMFVAPQTISSGSPEPTVTRVSDSRSASRMLLDGEELADDDVLPVGAPPLDALDLHPEQGQALGQLLRRQLDVDVLAQPATAGPSPELLQEAQVVLHVQAQVADRSGARFAIRSTPMPKAKPW